MPTEVVESMREAATSFIHLNELHERVGDKLAEMIGVEAGVCFLWCCKRRTGLCRGVSDGTDMDRVHKLPDTSGVKNEFIISLVDSHFYIHQGIEAVWWHVGQGWHP